MRPLHDRFHGGVAVRTAGVPDTEESIVDGNEGSKEESEEEPDVLTIDDEKTEEVLNSVASETARSVLASVQERGKTPGEISETLDTSTQNIRYHLDKLEAAGLVEVGGMRYSEKGREMSVYEAAESPPVIVIGSG